MARRDKRIEAMRRNPRQVRFSNLRAALEAAGFTARPGKGDHWVFFHEDGPQVTIDPARPFVKPFYVRLALAAIDQVQETPEP